MAEGRGFEPPIPVKVCRISSAVHSTTLPPLRKGRVDRPVDGGGINGTRVRDQGVRARRYARRYQQSLGR